VNSNLLQSALLFVLELKHIKGHFHMKLTNIVNKSVYMYTCALI
jgi:hypothetical protein